MIELFTTFFKLGLFTIGGGVAMIPVLRDIMVRDKKWFSEEEALEIISVCQSMPGVIAVNMATYVGFRRRGFLGSLVSTVGVVLPSFVVILIIARGLSSVIDEPHVAGMLGGLRAAAVGLIIVAAYQVTKGVMKDAFSVAGALIAFAAIALFRVNVLNVIVAFIVFGIVYVCVKAKRLPKSGAEQGDGGDPE